MTQSAPSAVRGAVYSLAAFGLYALYDMTVKFLGGSYSPVQILFFAGICGIPFVIGQLLADRAGGSLLPVAPGWTVLRIVITVVQGLIGSYAFTVLPLAQCYAIFFLMPILISLLAVPMLKEPVDLARGLGVVAGLIGVIIVLRPGRMPLEWGHLAALAGAVLGALNYLIIRKTGGVERMSVLMLYPFAGQLLVTALLLPFVFVPMPVAHLGLTWLMALELFVGSLCIIAAYRHAPAVVAAPMQYSQIIWATVFGVLFFDEHLDPQTALGIAVIIASGVFVLIWSGRPVIGAGPRESA